MVERLTEVAEKETSRRVNLAVERYKQATVSIYAEVEPDEIAHLGTGTIIIWNNQNLLLTARHLLEEGRAVKDFRAIRPDCLDTVSLDRRFLKSELDADLAVCALSDDEVAKLKAMPIDGRKFFSFPQAMTGRAICTFGWPNTKNKFDRYKGITPTLMVISGPQKTASSLGLSNVLDAEYVFQRYIAQDTIDVSLNRVNSPKLVGLSGGITFDLGHPLEPDVLFGSGNACIHPVGICTKHDMKLKAIRSTRPATFLRNLIEANGLSILADG